MNLPVIKLKPPEAQTFIHKPHKLNVNFYAWSIFFQNVGDSMHSAHKHVKPSLTQKASSSLNLALWCNSLISTLHQHYMEINHLIYYYTCQTNQLEAVKTAPSAQRGQVTSNKNGSQADFRTCKFQYTHILQHSYHCVTCLKTHDKTKCATKWMPHPGEAITMVSRQFQHICA